MVLRVLFDTILSSCSQILFFLVGIPLIVLNVFYSCCFLTIELSLLLDFFDHLFWPVRPCILSSLNLHCLTLLTLWSCHFVLVLSRPFCPCIAWPFWTCVLASSALCSFQFDFVLLTFFTLYCLTFLTMLCSCQLYDLVLFDLKLMFLT